MSQEEILEGNPLIAEFVGAHYDKEMTNRWFYLLSEITGPQIHAFMPTTEELEFHSNWNWLMPVVKIINKWNPSIRPFTRIPEAVDITITPTKVKLYASIWSTEDKNFGNWIILKKTFKSAEIESVYKAVVAFIKWFNKYKSKHEKIT